MNFYTIIATLLICIASAILTIHLFIKEYVNETFIAYLLIIGFIIAIGFLI